MCCTSCFGIQKHSLSMGMPINSDHDISLIPPRGEKSNLFSQSKKKSATTHSTPAHTAHPAHPAQPGSLYPSPSSRPSPSPGPGPRPSPIKERDAHTLSSSVLSLERVSRGQSLHTKPADQVFLRFKRSSTRDPVDDLVEGLYVKVGTTSKCGFC
jgi:hypothetical protein